MNNQVKITLTSLNGDVEPPQRIIYLNPDRRNVAVGRASKSASKGLLGAEDNAWFDSPVMSRHHAHLTFDTDNKILMIEDIGSMHGTYLNNVPVPNKTAMAVGDNDEVKFGAEVRRGPEVFPACRFRVNFEFVPYRAANTFEFPEYSDVEDNEEEECEFSDDANATGRTSSEDGVSIESPTSTNFKAMDPIDLTGDDTSTRNDLIDLTDEATSVERCMIGIANGRPTDIDESADSASIAVYAGNNITVLDSEDEDAHFSSESEDQLEDPQLVDSDSSDGDYGLDEVLDEILDDVEDEDEDEDEDGEEDDDDSEESESDTGIEEYPSKDSPADVIVDFGTAIRNIHRFAHATNEDSTVHLAEPVPADEHNADNEDNESDLGLSEAGAEGMKVLIDGGLLEQAPPATSNSEITLEINHTLQPNMVADIVPSTASERASEVISPRPLFQGTTGNPPFSTQLASIEKPLGLAHLSFRQPSPSDAAMVKTQVAVAATQIPSHVQPLGETSGKSAYFAAREINKVNIKRFEEQQSSRMIGNPFTPTPTSFRTQQLNRVESVDSAMAPHRGVCSFLDRPDTTPIMPHAPGKFPDETSAVCYTMSKDSMATAMESVTKPRVLKIQDMCDRPLPAPTSLKRKAHEMSSDADEGLRTWANGTSPTYQFTPNNASLVHHDSVERKSNEFPSVSNIDNPRPVKRFRKFMEKVGYAAIGGVAVGATLFTALVATAPNFT